MVGLSMPLWKSNSSEYYLANSLILWQALTIQPCIHGIIELVCFKVSMDAISKIHKIKCSKNTLVKLQGTTLITTNITWWAISAILVTSQSCDQLWKIGFWYTIVALTSTRRGRAGSHEEWRSINVNGDKLLLLAQQHLRHAGGPQVTYLYPLWAIGNLGWWPTWLWLAESTGLMKPNIMWALMALQTG